MSLCNDTLNQIKECNYRLEEKDKVIQDLADDLEQLRVQKVVVDDESLRLVNKYKALKEYANMKWIGQIRRRYMNQVVIVKVFLA